MKRDEKQLLSTVITASQIIELIGEEGSTTPVFIAKKLNLSRSNVHRLLLTLKKLGYVEERPGSKFYLTFKLFELGNTVPHKKRLIDSARPSMLRLAQLTGQTVNHGILYDDLVLYIDKVEANTYLKLDRSIGNSDPVHSTSLGKVLLAFQEAGDREKILNRLQLIPTTPQTITEAQLLQEELERVRREGVAFDRQELSRELNCVAAPVFDCQGRICSAISISGPVDKFTIPQAEEAVESLKATVREIQRSLCL
ncbi:MAG TPA: IclR family transcriptional regulator [Sediminispirochaeta sp.]|nr:IclR family transcriptional regulator [Sediminispirochaeta sp.]